MTDVPHGCENLAENHKRIWLGPLCQVEERYWCEDPQVCDDCGLEPIQYIRADLVEEVVARAIWNSERDNPQRAIWAPWGMLDSESREWVMQRAREALKTAEGSK